MSRVWHIAVGGKQSGPLSPADLKSLVQSGGLKPEDLVWKEGLTDWVPAGKIKGLFPPTPPPTPPLTEEASAIQTPAAATPREPALGEIVLPDDEASEAWKHRDSPMQGHVGIFSGLFQKSIQEFAFTHRQRTFRYFEDGREVARDEVLSRLENAYSNKGFSVRRFSSSLVLTKRNSRVSMKIDTSQNALRNVFTLSNAFVRISESSDSWVVEVKAEAFFWPRVMEQLMGMAGLICIGIIFFWPCLCLAPFALNVDADQVKAALQDDIKTPIEKLSIEFV